ncbi:hypothetical protein AB0P05_37245 [Streptomyces flaveolus]|uniref:hypothetical protein n=1 Tax=Streptomyces flaveolus TaxID=67297 RepID=UPI00342B5F71
MIATADVLLPPAPRCPGYDAEAGRHTACPESSAWAAETPGDASGAVVHVALGLDPGDDAPAEAPAVLVLEPVDVEKGTQEGRLMVEGADDVGAEQPQPGGVGEDTCAGAGGRLVGEVVVAHRLLATLDRHAGGRVVQPAQQPCGSGDLGGRPVTGPEGGEDFTMLEAEDLAALGIDSGEPRRDVRANVLQASE